MEFERSLRQGRHHKKLTQRDAAEMAGLETEEVVKLESGIFVSLSTEQLRRLSSVADIEETMFLMMYNSQFRQELKALRRQAQQASPGGEVQSIQPQCDPLPPDLAEFIKAITGLPSEARSRLLDSIRILVKAQMIEAAARAAV